MAGDFAEVLACDAAALLPAVLDAVFVLVLDVVLAAAVAPVLAPVLAEVAAGRGEAADFLAVFDAGLPVVLRVFAAVSSCDCVAALLTAFFAVFFAAGLLGRISLSPHNSSKR